MKVKSHFKFIFRFVLFFLVFFISKGDTAVPTTVSTFESIGIYWSLPEGTATNISQVQYRKSGETSWNNASPLWFDERDGEYRGSIVNLTPGTSYEIQLTLLSTQTSQLITASTWNENFPISQTITLPENSSQTLVINQGGTPNGYVLYTSPNGTTSTIDIQDKSNSNIEITNNAAYIIIRGITLKGASQNGILLMGGVHDIVIENNDISGWGTIGSGNQAAVFASGAAERIIIQRNRLHNPRSASLSWDFGHPGGPNAIILSNTLGNHVIRYNEIYSDFNHYFMDVIGGGTNDSNEGFPTRDSDIYGNYIANSWDDGIQVEGGDKNIRIWGNFIEDTFVKIAIAPVAVGPVYIWRNIGGRSRRSHTTDIPDDYGRGPFIKSGGDTQFNKGRVYVFHNTVLQPEPPVGQSFPLGSRGGILSSGGNTFEHISRNNIFLGYQQGTIIKDNTNSCTNDFDYDLYNGVISAACTVRPHELNGIKITGFPNFDPNNGPFVDLKGKFALKPGSSGIDAGIIIPNFNDNFLGSGPDIGAFELGSPPMEFGVNAYLNKVNRPEPRIPISVRISK